MVKYICKKCQKEASLKLKEAFKFKLCDMCYREYENRWEGKSRTCPVCGIEHQSPTRKLKCQKCHQAVAREWGRNNKRKRVESAQKWQQANKDKRLAYMKKWNREISNPRQRQRAHARKLALVLERGGCAKCGYIKNQFALAFHHDGIKQGEITKMIKQNHKNLAEEIARCTLLCHNCHSESHTRLWLEAQPTAAVSAWKKLKIRFIRNFGGQCKNCGYDKIDGLTFHHRDPTIKETSLWKAFRRHNIKIIEDELVKCDLLCRNCHAEVHYPEAPDLMEK